MKKYSTYVGMDCGDKRHHVCVLDGEGEVAEDERVGEERHLAASPLARPRRPRALPQRHASPHSPKKAQASTPGRPAPAC